MDRSVQGADGRKNDELLCVRCHKLKVHSGYALPPHKRPCLGIVVDLGNLLFDDADRNQIGFLSQKRTVTKTESQSTMGDSDFKNFKFNLDLAKIRLSNHAANDPAVALSYQYRL